MEVTSLQGSCNPLEDEAVTHLWGDHHLKPDKLNEMQMKALRNAMHHKFSLIQGPPGQRSSIEAF